MILKFTLLHSCSELPKQHLDDNALTLCCVCQHAQQNFHTYTTLQMFHATAVSVYHSTCCVQCKHFRNGFTWRCRTDSHASQPVARCVSNGSCYAPPPPKASLYTCNANCYIILCLHCTCCSAPVRHALCQCSECMAVTYHVGLRSCRCA